MADFEDRRKYLESLKDRLEALVAPKLIAAFNSHSSGKVVCVGVCVRACVRECVCECICAHARTHEHVCIVCMHAYECECD